MRVAPAILPVVCIAVLLAPCASAAVYTNSAKHYHFTAPDTWTQSAVQGVDVVFLEPSSGGSFRANLNVVSATDRAAKNDEAFLIATANQGISALQAQLGGTVLVSPHMITGAEGRPAAEYEMSYSLGGQLLRLRQVLFASDNLDMGWVITYTASNASFDAYNPQWSGVTNSFTVDNDVAPFPAILMVAIVGAIGGGAAGGVAYLMMKRKKQAELQAPAPAPYAPGQPPWPPQQPPRP